MDAFEAWLEHLFERGPGEFEPVPWYIGDSRPTEWTLRYEEGSPDHPPLAAGPPAGTR